MTKFLSTLAIASAITFTLTGCGEKTQTPEQRTNIAIKEGKPESIKREDFSSYEEYKEKFNQAAWERGRRNPIPKDTTKKMPTMFEVLKRYNDSIKKTQNATK